MFSVFTLHLLHILCADSAPGTTDRRGALDCGGFSLGVVRVSYLVDPQHQTVFLYYSCLFFSDRYIVGFGILILSAPLFMIPYFGRCNTYFHIYFGLKHC